MGYLCHIGPLVYCGNAMHILRENCSSCMETQIRHICHLRISCNILLTDRCVEVVTSHQQTVLSLVRVVSQHCCYL